MKFVARKKYLASLVLASVAFVGVSVAIATDPDPTLDDIASGDECTEDSIAQATAAAQAKFDEALAKVADLAKKCEDEEKERMDAYDACAKEKSDAAKQKERDIAAKNKTIQDQINRLKGDKERAEARKKKLEAQKKVNEGKRNAAQGRVDSINRDIDAADAEGKTIIEEYKRLRIELNNALARGDRRAANLARAQLAANSRKARQVRDKLARLQDKLISAQAEVNKFNDWIADDQVQIDTKQGEINACDDIIADKNKEIEDNLRTLESPADYLKPCADAYKALDGKLPSCNAHEAAKAALQKALEDLNNAIDACK